MEDPPYTEIDLVGNLSDLGVARDTIKLLEDRMGAKGLIVIVHAKDRIDQVESILVKNRGMLRTPMVTQPSSTMLRS
jgi:ABC-type transport system involved in cytochrome bd biosynthesis fused ATPase/permease subunit